MTDKLEGTWVVEGLVEGTLPDAPDAADHLREWVALAAEGGVRFNLAIEGNTFSLLAPAEAGSVADLGPDPAKRIGDVLRELMKIFPEGAKKPIFSTLRSVEFRPGQEVQTLYVVTPDGRVDVRGRTVEAETVPPARPLTRAEKVRLAVTGLGIAIAVLAISTFFVDYRTVFRNVAGALKPVDAESITVDSTVFEKYFTIEDKTLGRGRQSLVLTVAHGDGFPAGETQGSQAWPEADSPEARVALDSLVRGYVRCEYFDEKDEFREYRMVRIKDLRRKDPAKIILPLPREWRVQRIVITY